MGLSRVEDILQAGLDGTEMPKPLSRVEILLEEWVEAMIISGSYDSTTKKVILTLKNGQTIEFSIAELVNGLIADDYDRITLGNGKTLYISDTTPTGARTGDLWIGG